MKAGPFEVDEKGESVLRKDELRGPQPGIIRSKSS
jgi:hypothetical protein